MELLLLLLPLLLMMMAMPSLPPRLRLRRSRIALTGHPQGLTRKSLSPTAPWIGSALSKTFLGSWNSSPGHSVVLSPDRPLSSMADSQSCSVLCECTRVNI